MSDSQPRQNFHGESEQAINKQINLHLHASYVYQSMAFYYDRDDVALKGFHKYFEAASEEESEHAEKLKEYQNKRGGRIALEAIDKPPKDEWGSGHESFKTAHWLQKNINQKLLDLHEIATKHGDAQMTDFLEGEFLKDKVDKIKELSDHMTNLARVGSGPMGGGLGEWLYSEQLDRASDEAEKKQAGDNYCYDQRCRCQQNNDKYDNYK